MSQRGPRLFLLLRSTVAPILLLASLMPVIAATTINRIAPPPPNVTVEQQFTVSWATVGGTLTHPSVRVDVSDPVAVTALSGQPTTRVSGSTRDLVLGSGTVQLTAPIKKSDLTLITTPIFVKYVVADADALGIHVTLITVTVNPVNDLVDDVNDMPTLTVIQTVAIDEDAGTQTTVLEGITAGGGETQSLRVWAESDNPELIMHPTVSYSSPARTGILSYAPLANQFGSAIITVTVSDPGLDGEFRCGFNPTDTRMGRTILLPKNWTGGQDGE